MTVMQLKFALGEIEVDVDLAQELLIDTSSPEVIAEQLKEAPAIMFYWGGLAEKAAVMDAKVRSQHEKWLASVYDEIKDGIIERYGKTGATETAIKNEIRKQFPAESSDWNKKVEESRYRKNMLNWARDCFAKKNDNLVNLLAYYRRLAENGG
jgi:hypothetical protein